MKRHLGIPKTGKSDDLLGYLVKANHTSPLEHVTFQFQIENVSRSFLAQITRHRMASYTTSSQHYQDYRDYPLIMSAEMAKHVSEGYNMDGDTIIESIYGYYKYLVDLAGIPPEEARQILPNAAAVNIIWTINARSLMNFLNLRLCNRNVQEMRIFAARVRGILATAWAPFYGLCGPDCINGECRQGNMQCKEGFYERL
jgi:thymidylate synthase (FAD)